MCVEGACVWGGESPPTCGRSETPALKPGSEILKHADAAADGSFQLASGDTLVGYQFRIRPALLSSARRRRRLLLPPLLLLPRPAVAPTQRTARTPSHTLLRLWRVIRRFATPHPCTRMSVCGPYVCASHAFVSCVGIRTRSLAPSLSCCARNRRINPRDLAVALATTLLTPQATGKTVEIATTSAGLLGSRGAKSTLQAGCVGDVQCEGCGGASAATRAAGSVTSEGVHQGKHSRVPTPSAIQLDYYLQVLQDSQRQGACSAGLAGRDLRRKRRARNGKERRTNG